MLNVAADGDPQQAQRVETQGSLVPSEGEQVPLTSGELDDGRAWPERGDPDEHLERTEAQGRSRKQGSKEVRRAQRAAKKAVLEVVYRLLLHVRMY